jgi:hypothetical protein
MLGVLLLVLETNGVGFLPRFSKKENKEKKTKTPSNPRPPSGARGACGPSST